MVKDLSRVLKGEKIQSLGYREPLLVSRKTPVEEVIRKMRDEKIGSVLIVEKDKLAGIFTESDVLTRVVEPKAGLTSPIENFMTANPKTLRGDDSVAEAIRVMSHGGYRHIPLTDPKGRITGILSVRQVVTYLAEHFPYQIINLPPNVHQVQRAKEGA